MKIKKLNDFIIWTQQYDKISEDSAISYDSYVRNAFLTINKEVSNITSTTKVEKIINYFSQENIAIIHNKSRKTISNYLSGLRLYGEYLYDTSQDLIIEDSFDIKITNTLFFEKLELYKNFTFRLITQDRFYQEIFFPISLVKQILYLTGNKKTFDLLLHKMLDNIIIHTDKEILKLEDIDSLRIQHRSVNIKAKDTVYKVFTPNQSNSKIPFKASDLSNISLDHITSQHSIMHQFANELPTFRSLTNLLKPSVTDRRSLNQFKKNYGLDNIVKSVNTNSLIDELNLIMSQTQLQLMDRSINTSKGKK